MVQVECATPVMHVDYIAQTDRGLRVCCTYGATSESFSPEELRLATGGPPVSLTEPVLELIQGLIEAVERHRGPVDYDWACIRCRPNTDMEVDGFRCVYHRAVDFVRDGARRECGK